MSMSDVDMEVIRGMIRKEIQQHLSQPTESSLSDLLVRWAELEPERCKERWNYTAFLFDNYMVEEPHSPTDLWVVAGAVQAAIEARGWYWMVWKCHLTSNGFGATITSHGSDCFAPTAAEALLSAYLGALGDER